MPEEKNVLASGIQKDSVAGSRFTLHMLINMTLSLLHPIFAEAHRNIS